MFETQGGMEWECSSEVDGSFVDGVRMKVGEGMRVNWRGVVGEKEEGGGGTVDSVRRQESRL